MSRVRSKRLMKFLVVGMVIVGMILWMLPSAMIGADDAVLTVPIVNLNDTTPFPDCGNCAPNEEPDPIAPAGYECVKFEIGDNTVKAYSWTAPDTCDVGSPVIDHVWIKAGNTVGNLISNNGPYGGWPTSGYLVEGLGSQTVTVTESVVAQDISHICFYWKCEDDDPDPGYIKVNKSFTGGVTNVGTNNFTFNVYGTDDSNDPDYNTILATEPLAITDSASGSVCIPKSGTDPDIIDNTQYYVAESSDTDTRIAVTAASTCSDDGAVSFVNDLPGKIRIKKSFLGAKGTGTFNFNVYENSSGGLPINTTPISITISDSTFGV